MFKVIFIVIKRVYFFYRYGMGYFYGWLGDKFMVLNVFNVG